MNNKWILTSERQPEKEGTYIITTRYGEVGYMHYYNSWNKYNDDSKYEIDSSYIKAWMPFPEPYNEGEDNKFFCGSAERREEQAKIEQLEHDILYEPTFSEEEGSM